MVFFFSISEDFNFYNNPKLKATDSKKVSHNIFIWILFSQFKFDGSTEIARKPIQIKIASVVASKTVVVK